MRLAWDHPLDTATGFAMFIDGGARQDLGAIEPGTDGTYSTPLPTLPAGGHNVEVLAYNTGGDSPHSSPLGFTIEAPPPPPPLPPSTPINLHIVPDITPPSSLWSNEPSGWTTIHETSWEDGTLSGWFRKFTSGDKPITVLTIVDSLLAETRALNIGYVVGHVGGGGTELEYAIPLTQRRNEIYVGYYVQVNPAWQGHNSAINKMIYLFDGGAAWSSMWYEMFGSGSNSLGLYVVNQEAGQDIGYHENINNVTFTRGQWHKVEIYQKQGNPGSIKVWVNNVLAIDRSDVITLAEPVNSITISGIWGGVGDSKDQADYMRFDRVRISRP
mgnify:CR=1 FL=1